MNITASDRASLLRLASSLPVGDESRRAILSGLKRVAQTILDSLIQHAQRESDPHRKAILEGAVERERTARHPSGNVPGAIGMYLHTQGVLDKLSDDAERRGVAALRSLTVPENIKWDGRMAKFYDTLQDNLYLKPGAMSKLLSKNGWKAVPTRRSATFWQKGDVVLEMTAGLKSMGGSGTQLRGVGWWELYAS